ncbi:MAG TPA: phosphoglycerate mutase family protein [Acidimicrobiales bacterium]|jgi:8-oxo-dGTP diphosphatase|nr:phosphoglycerate mutase family protein [Acidimicrobiales bacterium]
MRIVLARHGHAEPKKGWVGADGDRPLVARGQRQAQTLLKVVGRPRPTLIVSSPAARCRQSVEPMGRELGLTPTLSPSLATDAGLSAVQLIHDLAGGSGPSTVVLCTHREVLTVVLPHLASDSGRKLGHRLPGAKGGVWVLDYRGGRLRSIEYRPPAA